MFSRLWRIRHRHDPGHYVHDDDESKLYGAEPGHVSPNGDRCRQSSDLLFYEGPWHGAVVTDKVNIAPRHCRSQDRRRARDQPRMDPEAAP